jgi:hypothetical protein
MVKTRQKKIRVATGRVCNFVWLFYLLVLISFREAESIDHSAFCKCYIAKGSTRAHAALSMHEIVFENLEIPRAPAARAQCASSLPVNSTVQL